MANETLEDLEIFRIAEQMCDRFYDLISPWSTLDKEIVGSQLVRAADRVGAYIAESHGRFHYADRLNFLYIARGGVYETRFWVRRAYARQLWPVETCDKALNVLDELTKKLNAYILEKQERRPGAKPISSQISEPVTGIETDPLYTLIDDRNE